MHTDTPITLRLELMTAAIVGSARPESFTLYHLNGNFVTKGSPGRSAALPLMNRWRSLGSAAK